LQENIQEYSAPLQASRIKSSIPAMTICTRYRCIL